MSAMLTRAHARAVWVSSGLSYGNLSLARLEALRARINDELRASRPIRGFCSRHRPVIHFGGNGSIAAELRCSAYYFTDREAVTFNDNGFIGFAGWASDENVQPILRAFVEWVAEVARQLQSKASPSTLPASAMEDGRG